MDWNKVESSWRNLREKIKERWGKFTEGEIVSSLEEDERLSGRIQKEYDRPKTEEERRVGPVASSMERTNKEGLGRGAEKQ